MKQAIVSIFFFTLANYAFASPGISIRGGDGDSLHVTSSSIHDMYLDIMRVTGLQANFELKEAKVLNIEASVSHHKRYILYNADFINNMIDAGADRWSNIALLAHEIGHHLNGHTIKRGGSKPALELEADEFAGFVLYRLGATLKQAQSVMQYIASDKGSSTHPGRQARIDAIAKGWSKASGIL